MTWKQLTNWISDPLGRCAQFTIGSLKCPELDHDKIGPVNTKIVAALLTSRVVHTEEGMIPRDLSLTEYVALHPVYYYYLIAFIIINARRKGHVVTVGGKPFKATIADEDVV